MYSLNRETPTLYYWAPINPDRYGERIYINALEARQVLERRGCPPELLNRIMTETESGTIML